MSVDGELHAASSMHLYEGEDVVELEELDVDTVCLPFLPLLSFSSNSFARSDCQGRIH